MKTSVALGFNNLPNCIAAIPDHQRSRDQYILGTMVNCVDEIISKSGNDPNLSRTCALLRLVKQEYSLIAMGKTLGWSREHVTGAYNRKAIELATQEFLSTIGHNGLACKIKLD